MTFVYDLTIDPDAENNTHAYALELIGHNKTVLEVGCATGYFTKVLAERGCKVIGMEIDAEAAKIAETWAERVIVGSVEDAEPWEQVDDEGFDVITFGDVLEHLRDPLAALRLAAHKLKPTGFIVTSLPNVAHGDVRLALLHGSFPYSDLGLLDRTHLRFFTLQSIRELFREAGFTVVDTRRVVMPMFGSELGVKREDYADVVLEEIQSDPEFETYQFVMKAVLDNGSQSVAELAARLEELSDQVHELQVQKKLLDERVADYTQLSETVGIYSNHIEDLTRQVHELHDYAGALTGHSEGLERLVETLRTDLEASEQRYDAIVNSKSYRLTEPLRRLRAGFQRGRPA